MARADAEGGGCACVRYDVRRFDFEHTHGVSDWLGVCGTKISVDTLGHNWRPKIRITGQTGISNAEDIGRRIVIETEADVEVDQLRSRKAKGTTRIEELASTAVAQVVADILDEEIGARSLKRLGSSLYSAP
jgi:hypothetical protein